MTKNKFLKWAIFSQWASGLAMIVIMFVEERTFPEAVRLWMDSMLPSGLAAFILILMVLLVLPAYLVSSIALLKEIPPKWATRIYIWSNVLGFSALLFAGPSVMGEITFTLYSFGCAFIGATIAELRKNQGGQFDA